MEYSEYYVVLVKTCTCTFPKYEKLWLGGSEICFLFLQDFKWRTDRKLIPELDLQSKF